MPTSVLSVESVSKAYREAGVVHPILSDLSLELPRGSFAALLGRSGSGKSTLLNVIGGIDVPDSGRVVIEDVDVATLGEEERTAFRRVHLGFVFQSFNLIPTLTVGENAALPLVLSGMSERDAAVRARAMLDRVGLADRMNAWPDRLSGGEQQRVAIVRALVHKPALVLADEPTGNLDYETGRTVMGLLHGLVREMGVTMLVVTHDREFLNASDVVLEMRGGTLEIAGAQ